MASLERAKCQYLCHKPSVRILHSERISLLLLFIARGSGNALLQREIDEPKPEVKDEKDRMGNGEWGMGYDVTVAVGRRRSMAEE